MKREEKQEIVKALAERIKSYGNFYITDTADLTVSSVNGIRRKCYDEGIAMQVVKNTLIKKALEEAGVDSEELLGVLKGSSTMLFAETGSAPAKLIKQLEEKMYAHARDLEFEEAARLRDEIRRIQADLFSGA